MAYAFMEAVTREENVSPQAAMLRQNTDSPSWKQAEEFLDCESTQMDVGNKQWNIPRSLVCV